VAVRKATRNVDFVGGWRKWFAGSLAVILLGLAAIGLGRLNLGIDFTGGAEFTITDPGGNVTDEQVEAALPAGLSEDATAQRLGNGDFEVTTPPLSQSESAEARDALSSEFDSEVSVTTVSPTFGGQVRDQALTAVGVALAVIVVFISYRFEFAFAMAAIAAIIHDILITVGIYALVGREVNLVTVVAVLTVLGYSLYDTVIIFDRIRENTPEENYERSRFDRLVNDSIRQVITRSIYTSLSTLIPITALLIFGGSTLSDFAFALLVGILAGTYSSIFIASPTLSLYKAWRGNRPQRQDDVEPGQV
jgi:preprotein translocase subunit SecF